MNLPGEPGERSLSWFLNDDIQGLVMRGAIELSTGAADGAVTGATS